MPAMKSSKLWRDAFLGEKRASSPSLSSIFLCAVEYGLILPTIWAYLNSLHEERHWFLGVVISFFNVAQLFCAPVVGWMSDRMSMKSILMVTLGFNIVGNLVYFAAQGAWMVLLGRILAGMGASSGPVIMSYVVRVTSEKERTAVVTKVIAVQEAGLLIGPGLNFALAHFNFPIGSLTVNSLTAPGFCMAIISLCAVVMVLCFFMNPPPVETDKGRRHSALATEMRKGGWAEIREELLTLPILVIYLAEFVLLFNQTTLETIVTMLTKQFFDWDETRNSIMYITIAVVFMVCYVIIHILSQRLQDRYLIAIGLAFEGTAFILDLIFMPRADSNGHMPMWQFVLTVTVFVIGLPFFMVAVPSLFSKLTTKRRQGLAQGLLQVMASLGCICGPLWGGVSYENSTSCSA
eukprot:Opistho-2@24443